MAATKGSAILVAGGLLLASALFEQAGVASGSGTTDPKILAQGAPTASPGVSPQASPQVPRARLVRIPFPQDDGTLTPYTFELGYPLVTLIYDTLMWRDEQGIPQPWLADRVETSPDGRQITVLLREDAKWQDGVPLTAADIAFTFRYVAEHPHPRFTPELRAVERVEATGPLTAVIYLRHPSPGFFDQPLADMPILPMHLWQALPAGRIAPEGLPIGSGPYKLIRYLPDEAYRFEAYAEYFRGEPAAEIIDVPIIGDAGRTFSALENGRVDMIPVSLPAESVERFDDIGTRTAKGAHYLGTVLMFNLRRPPFDQMEVRQAVAKSLDVNRIADNVGQAVVSSRGYLHPLSEFAPEKTIRPGGDSPIERSVLDDLPVEVLAPDNDPIKLQAGRQVVLALKRAGADAELTELSREDLSAAVGEDGSPPSFQAAIWGAPPLASYDPDFLRRLFGSDPAQAPFNYPGYANPAFDQLGENIATTLEPTARKAAVEEALTLLSTEVPVVPLFFSQGVFAYRPSRYDGWKYIKGTGILDKRSFVEPKPSSRRGPYAANTPSATDQNPPTKPPGGFPFGLVALGFAGLAAIIGIGAYWQSRR